jgi:hypothetical protein
MVIPIIIGIILLAIIVFSVIRIVKDVLLGLVLIGLTLLAVFLILGFIPSLRSIPIIGPWLPRLPTSLTGAVEWIWRIIRNLKVVEVSRDVENNLLITISNMGRLQLSGFKIYVDNKTTKIINKPKDPLKPGETTTIQTDWNKDFNEILVQTSKVNATYKR